MRERKMSGSETLTTIQLADIFGVSKQAVTKRAEKEGWTYVIGENRSKLYYVDKLPPEIKVHIIRDRYGIDEETDQENHHPAQGHSDEQ